MPHKHLQVRLPTPLFEAFFAAFPGHGERTKIITEVISLLVESKELGPKKVAKFVAEEMRRQLDGQT